MGINPHRVTLSRVFATVTGLARTLGAQEEVAGMA